MDAEFKVTELLGDHLHGERVTCAVYATTRRWYSIPAAFVTRSPSGEHTWWLALTDERVFILSTGSGETGRRAERNVQAQRSEVAVERFRRTGIATWSLALNVHGDDRWSLHSATVFGFPLGSNIAKARQIAEGLGWRP